MCAFSVDAIKTAMTGRFVDPSSFGSIKIPAVNPPSSSITECKAKGKFTYFFNDPLLPKEQAGFRRGKSTVDQVVLLTQNIGNSFEAKKKAGAIFIDLTAAYDTVWHRGLTCKLLRLLPDKHMVRMIMDACPKSKFHPYHR